MTLGVRAGRRIRTSVGVSRQIYSLLPLAARTSRRTPKPCATNTPGSEGRILARGGSSAQAVRARSTNSAQRQCPTNRCVRTNPASFAADLHQMVQEIPIAMLVSRSIRSSVGG